MSAPTTNSNQEIITEEVQEIVSKRLHWFIRKGNMLLLTMAFIFLSIAWLIKYPDTIKATARIVAINPPKLIRSKVDGKLIRLFITEEQEVKKDQLLGYLGNTASIDEVLTLKDWVGRAVIGIDENRFDSVVCNYQPHLNNLGELQSSYQQFCDRWEQAKQILPGKYYQQKIFSLKKDLQHLDFLKNINQQQRQLEQLDKALKLKEYTAYESLARDKVIAPLELNQYKSQLISKDKAIEQLSIQTVNNDLSNRSKQKELLEVENQVREEQQRFRTALLELKSEIGNWVQQYLLIAVEDGRVLFAESLQENQAISAGEDLLYIQPTQSKFYIEITSGQKGLGKIRIGQQVLIKPHGYPSNEFGYLVGKIEHIPVISGEGDSFLLKASLINGLKTNFNKQIIFRNGLTAQAEIITNERRLLNRMMGQLKEIFE